MRMLAIGLLVVGVLALVYGGFSYSKETHEGNVGPLSFSFSERERVNVPVWVGVVFVIAGAGLLIKGRR